MKRWWYVNTVSLACFCCPLESIKNDHNLHLFTHGFPLPQIHSHVHLGLNSSSPNSMQDRRGKCRRHFVCFEKLNKTNCEIMSEARDTLCAHSCSSMANINTACSDLCPHWCLLGLVETYSFITTHTLSPYIITDSLLANSCLMTSPMLKKREKRALNFYFEIYIPLNNIGGLDICVSKVGLTGARLRGQTVLLHCGITSWLKWKCIVTATRPLILLAAADPMHDL